jgi:hypothetical protein
MPFGPRQIGQAVSSMFNTLADLQIVGGEVNQECAGRSYQHRNRRLNGNVADPVYKKIKPLLIPRRSENGGGKPLRVGLD